MSKSFKVKMEEGWKVLVLSWNRDFLKFDFVKVLRVDEKVNLPLKILHTVKNNNSYKE
jgi:hypothetical protein